MERYGGGPIVVRDYDPRWPALFEQEQARIRQALGSMALAIDHVGSTAVPGLAAKPIIDIAVAVRDLGEARSNCIEPLQALGYTYLPENESWLPEELMFRKSVSGIWTRHAHVMEQSSARWEEFILIRDYLRCHPEIAGAYGDLKKALALVFGEDIAGYRSAKSPFVQALMARARGSTLYREQER